MTYARKELEDVEWRDLASYAAHSTKTLGRHFPESDHPVRSCFQRDRDRVLHSRCFRRLEYKTQVFVNGTADHYRTRLTHTIEMTAIGRTLARAFHANEDLTETICLAHDVGHSPFGHRGEFVLDELMKGQGGFDHNLQSLRAVEKLEYAYPKFRGLNLSWEVRSGLLKHEAAKPGAQLDGFPIGPFQMLEAQIADVADDMSYYAHDVDDGLEAGLISPHQLDRHEFWRLAAARTHEQYSNLERVQFLRITIRNLLDLQVQDVIGEGERRLEKHRPQSIVDIMNAPERLIVFSDAMAEMLKDFSDFLYKQLYYHPVVSQESIVAVELMRGLFLHYIKHPEAMGNKSVRRIPEEGLWRTVCDYVAGCTDRYALEECEKYRIS